MFLAPHGAAYLREVEESRLAEQDVSQEHGAAGQYLNLVFTIMMAPQELTKVPTSESASRRDECGRVGGKMAKRRTAEIESSQIYKETMQRD